MRFIPFASIAALAWTLQPTSDYTEVRKQTPEPEQVYGRIQLVDSLPDVKVKVVTALPDLRVRRVQALANRPGEWQLVDALPDFKVQIVDALPDFTIQWVVSLAGPK